MIDLAWVVEVLDDTQYVSRFVNKNWRRYIQAASENKLKPFDYPPGTLEDAITFLNNRFHNKEDRPPSGRYASVRIRNLETDEVIPFEALGI